MTANAAPACSLRELQVYFLRLGATGFGGPVALVGYMQRDLVEARRWFTAEEYRRGLALAQLAPGPLAAQLAMYLGWARRGAVGAALVGLAFVLPSFLMVIAIASLYLRLGGLPWMQGAFYGIGAAVVAVMARSAAKLTRITLERDPLLWALFSATALVTAWTESEIVWLFVGAGIVVLAARSGILTRLPRTALAVGLVPAALVAGVGAQPDSATTLWRLGWYFVEAGAFVFGSGLAIVPFLHAGVVQEFGWLTERQFLDAVAVAMITPGPVVITVGFIGFLVAGLPGSVVAALGTFLPCYLCTVLPAPHFARWSQNKPLKAFVDGVTAAATGAIAGAAIVLGRRALVDWTSVLVAVGSLVVLTRHRRVPEPLLMTAAGVLGVLLIEPASPSSRTVVFVCEHGSAKSLVAASLFERMAKERGIGLRAVARGTAPDTSVPAAVVEALRSDGFDVAAFRPQGLGEPDLRSAERLVAIGVDLGRRAGPGVRVERWDDIPPVSTSYAEARQAIVAHLEALLRDLEPAGQRLGFDEQDAGGPPKGMTCGLTGGGRPGVWRVEPDETAPSARHVLVQADGDATSYRFPHCVVDGPGLEDLELSVNFKPVSGRVDQAGGLVFRYRDADNYYVVRANALEGNVVLYKVEKGKRTDLKPKGSGLLAYGKKSPVPSGKWSELRVAVDGSLFDVWLNGLRLFQVEDATFPGPGRYGVWTKADSITRFDDLKAAASR